MERWKPVKNYEKLYLISDQGRVKTLRGITPRFLTLSLEKKGYLKVRFFINKKIISSKVHILVAKHFLSNYDDTKQINHKDGNKTNNFYKNLECVTNRENCSHYNINRKTKSKYIGVDWSISNNKWRSRIRINKKRFHLGYFNDEIDAANAYKQALIKYNIQNKYIA